MHEFTLKIPSGFDFETTVNSGQSFRWRQDDGLWLGVDGDSLYAVRVKGSKLQISSNHPPSKFENLFDLHRDYEQIFRELEQENPAIATFLLQSKGLRMMLGSSVVEVLFSFQCASNSNLPRIRNMVDALVSYGRRERLGELQFRLFPDLQVLANLTETELRAKGLGYRAKHIGECAQAILERGGERWLAGLKSQPFEEAWKQLQTLPGIGPKLASCIALYGLHFLDACPLDVHLREALSEGFMPELARSSLTQRVHLEVRERLRTSHGDRAGLAQLIFYHGHLRRGRR